MPTPNVTEIIEKATDAISKSENLKKQFETSPAKAIESVIGVQLPEDIVNKVVDAVKAGLAAKSVSAAFGNLKKLF